MFEVINYHEVMSNLIEKNGEYFMYVIKFKLTTRALHGSKKFLNVKSSVRKVISRSVIKKESSNYLRGGNNISAYVSLKNPYFNMDSRSYAHVKIRREKDEVVWRSNVEKHFIHYLTGEKELNINDVLKNPKDYFPESNNDLIILINKSIHSVSQVGKMGAGVGLPEKREFFQLVAKHYPKLTMNEPLQRISYRYRNGKPFFPIVDKRLELEVFTDDQRLLSRIHTELINVLSLEKVDEYLFKEPKTQLELAIRHHQLGALITDLDGEGKSAVKKRIKEIKKYFQNIKSDKPIMALVEIDRFHEHPTTEKRDPKEAVRLAMLEMGRITQFIHPLNKEKGNKKEIEEIKKDNNARINKSVLDLLSDKGFMKDTVNQNLQEDEIVVGVGIYSKNKNEHIPLLCKVDNHVKYIKTYMDREWLPIDQAIISLNAEKVQRSSIKQHIYSWVEQEIELLLEEHCAKTIIVIIDAVLRNYKWPELNNPNMSLERLPFQREELKKNDRLRVIRMNSTEEVPYYDITEPHKELTRNKGLFFDENGLYYSIGIRPDTLQISKHALRLTTDENIGKQRNIELVVSGCSSKEERDRLALLCHNLRRANITYDKSTKLPLPMHCLETMKGYIETFLNNQ